MHPRRNALITTGVRNTQHESNQLMCGTHTAWDQNVFHEHHKGVNSHNMGSKRVP